LSVITPGMTSGRGSDCDTQSGRLREAM
jgi:hypothetical protein